MEQNEDCRDGLLGFGTCLGDFTTGFLDTSVDTLFALKSTASKTTWAADDIPI